MTDTSRQEGGFTQLMYHMATAEALTLAQAVEQLKQNAHIRTVREVLAKAAGIPLSEPKVLQTFLTEKLLENSPPGTPSDSVQRKVRMWLKDGVQMVSKQSAIQLSFILGLSTEEANEFLYRACGEGFHWRDPGEIVFLYALEEGLSYLEALELYADMERKGLLAVRADKNAESLTAVVKAEVKKIGSAAELEDYLRESGPQIGAFHNTAYGLFRAYLDLLIDPEIKDDQGSEGKRSVREIKDDQGSERKLSVREISDAYLHQKFIPRVQKAQKGSKNNEKARDLVLSALQRDIHQNWPDETMLSKMLNRKADVTRKVLILLFLATDGDTKDSIRKLDLASLKDDDPLPEDEEAEFEDLQFRMNAMLADCGFAPLDSRMPFDWMVLYCTCVDETMLIDERVQHFLSAIFPASDPNDETP